MSTFPFSADRCSGVSPALVCALRSGVRVAEDLRGLHEAEEGGPVEGGEAAGVGDVEVGALTDEQLHYGVVALAHGAVQRSAVLSAG